MLMLLRPRGGSEKQMLAIDARETVPAAASHYVFDNNTQQYTGMLLV